MYRIERPKASAPIPKQQTSVVENSMKLYSFLLCLSGLADYPQNTRMFRQKNICLTEIEDKTGITDKTTKLYLAILECNGLVLYRGLSDFDDKKRETMQFDYSLVEKYVRGEIKRNNPELTQNIRDIWNLRKKNREGVYWIPRPNPYTPIPEVTLEKLNDVFNASELEFKLYFICCGYRDTILDGEMKTNKKKNLHYADLNELLGKTHQTNNNKAIRHALSFLQGVGLVEYQDSYYVNQRNKKISCFSLTEVHYYINKEPQEITENEVLGPQEIMALKDRIQHAYEELEGKINYQEEEEE